jgi:GTP cyclohydrolase I
MKSNLSPDIATHSRPLVSGRLHWVGMEKIGSPLKLRLADGTEVLAPGEIDVGVSLDDPSSRGIHMSRMFKLVQDRLTEVPVSLQLLRDLLAELIPLQGGLSQSGQLRVRFQLPLKTEALISGESGWRQYPVWLEAAQTASGKQSRMGFEILYSSTCPCSAALAQQVFAEKFNEEFGRRASLSPHEVQLWLQDTGLVATPHAQRSRAEISLEIRDTQMAPEVSALIKSLEETLGTAVQATVKRADEQEFARLNAENLMFCEDAARRLKAALDADIRIADFKVRVEHQESLHAHDAVAVARKDLIPHR